MEEKIHLIKDLKDESVLDIIEEREEPNMNDPEIVF
jgi:hypothetical protein